ncbi:MAG: 50S ribosomal protein L25/general stress protein Ctc [Bacteroidales bacterium]|jgi:large subunit ribosomal protein L25|nr:50S ribosomal protein L25/general stress protein Ctc [Bacteroidales bacterium]MDD2617435.1 50S ribosomal protein L25/general stress protein Ctc [Bacteroidales bacterium]NLB03741.1 50S ribosomal protein L25/general stress protein Ctc [Bacteroidales bacterium]
MKTFELNGSPRADFGKKASKNIRKSGNVPCVLYGGEENLHFQVKKEELRALLFTPEVYLVKLTIADKVYMSILQDVQFHPVSDDPLHLDFLQIFEDKPIVIEVPVKLNGLAAGVKSGGKLSLDMRKLKVKALYKNLPDNLDIDITNLELGKTVQVGDLRFDNMELMNTKNAVVCAVKLTRVARGIAAATAATGSTESQAE